MFKLVLLVVGLAVGFAFAKYNLYTNLEEYIKVGWEGIKVSYEFTKELALVVSEHFKS